MSRKVSVASFIEDNIIGTSRKIVSTSDMIHAVRSAFPACEHTNDELAQLIAMLAIRMGRNVNFNRVPEVANDDIRLPDQDLSHLPVTAVPFASTKLNSGVLREDLDREPGSITLR